MLARRTIISAVSLTAALFANSALASPFTLSGIAGGALTAGDLTGWVSFPTLNGGNAERVYIGPLNMTVTDQEMAAHIEGKLARYKHPASYVFWPELPKSGYGKVVKRDVKRLLEAT